MNKGSRKSIKVLVFAAVLLCGSLCFTTGVKAYVEKSAEIKGGKTNIRADGNTDAAVITSQSGGFKLTIVDEKKDAGGNVWYRVNFQLNGATKTGYIMSDFVTITGEAAPAQSGAAPAGSSAAVSENVSITDLQAEVDGAVYNIAAEVPKSKIPEGFTDFNAKYQGKDITVVKNKQTNVILAYLKGDGKEGLFAYDPDTSKFSAYNPSSPAGGSAAAVSSSAASNSSSNKSAASSTEIEELKFQRFLMMVAISAEGVIILVLIIALALKGRKGRDDYDDFDAFDDDEDDDDEDDDYDYGRRRKEKTRGGSQARSEVEIDKAVQNIVAREEAERARAVDDYKKDDYRRDDYKRDDYRRDDYRKPAPEPDDDYRPAKRPQRSADAARKSKTEFEVIDFDDM